jgi:hypothetical protein
MVNGARRNRAASMHQTIARWRRGAHAQRSFLRHAASTNARTFAAAAVSSRARRAMRGKIVLGVRVRAWNSSQRDATRCSPPQWERGVAHHEGIGWRRSQAYLLAHSGGTFSFGGDRSGPKKGAPVGALNSPSVALGGLTWHEPTARAPSTVDALCAASSGCGGV